MKYIKTQDLLNKKTLTYREILNIKKRLNGYAKSKEESGVENYEFKDEYKITKEHSDKGLKWLYKIAIKPSMLDKALEMYEAWGIDDKWLRKNNPLGYRELNILFQFHHFTFVGFYDSCMSQYALDKGFHSYLPIWRCYDKDGYSFEYYVSGGEINIIG